MTTRQRVVDEARSWVGTTWAHQQSTKGVGVDCSNFVARVVIDTGAIDALDYPTDYPRNHDGSLMEEIIGGLADYVPGIEEAQPADVVAFHDGRRKDRMRHLAFVSQLEPYVKVVHSSERGVKEHRLDAYLRSCIHSIWRIPGLDG